MSRSRLLPSLVLMALLPACGDDGGSGDPDAGTGEPDAAVGPGPIAPFPELACPGSPGCAGSGDGIFRVGAGRADINPTIIESEWDDANGNHHFDSGESFTDVNGNGVFDGTWIAGFGNARPAIGNNDDLWVRAIVFELNDLRVALAVIDCVGWFSNEIEATRALLPASLEIDHLIVASTHVHQAVDTLGMWGRKALETGVNQDYQARVRQRTVDAVAAAVAGLEPVVMNIARVETLDESGSPRNYVGDIRDPIILDPRVTVMQFLSVARPGETVATMVHWASHPEYAGDKNNLLSADYVYWLREVIEHGLPENPARELPAVDGLGGEVVFLNGALGGQIGPFGAHPIDDDGEEVSSNGLPKAEAAGKGVGRLALEAITRSEGVTTVEEPGLRLRTGRMNLLVENTYYHVAGLVGVFDRPFFGYDESKSIGPGNLPHIESRTTYLEVGPVGIITAPGELHPELFIGGYDGSHSYGTPIIAADNPNPPRLDEAPEGPYLEEIVLMNEGIEFALLLGMGEDFVGYIVPAYNYRLHPDYPYIEEAEGDHYEETNSLGPLVEEQVVGVMRQLVEWRP